MVHLIISTVSAGSLLHKHQQLHTTIIYEIITYIHQSTINTKHVLVLKVYFLFFILYSHSSSILAMKFCKETETKYSKTAKLLLPQYHI